MENWLNTIIIGDSEHVLKGLPESFIDLVVTSPPYNFNMPYEAYVDQQPIDKYFLKISEIMREVYRVLKPSGRVAIVIQPNWKDRVPTPAIITNLMLDIGFKWYSEIIWNKNNFNAKLTSWGSWLSPSAPYIKGTYEHILIFYKKHYKKEGDPSKADLTPEEFKTYTRSPWSIPPERDMDKYGHPAMFPEEIPKRLIKLLSYQEDIVLDPFNGVGTTTAVATSLNRFFIGIDISKKYCQVAYKRTFDRWSQRSLLYTRTRDIRPTLIDLSQNRLTKNDTI